MSERQWQADLDEQRDGWSHERRVIAAMEDYLDKCINIEVEIATLELFMEPEDAEVCLTDILKHAKEKVVVFCQREEGPFCGKQEALVGVPRREGSRARKLAKRVGRHQVTRNSGKSTSLPREVFENAVAAAKLVFNQGGRKSVDFCGRQAQAARRF